MPRVLEVLVGTFRNLFLDHRLLPVFKGDLKGDLFDVSMVDLVRRLSFALCLFLLRTVVLLSTSIEIKPDYCTLVYHFFQFCLVGHHQCWLLLLSLQFQYKPGLLTYLH